MQPPVLRDVTLSVPDYTASRYTLFTTETIINRKGAKMVLFITSLLRCQEICFLWSGLVGWLVGWLVGLVS